MVKQSSKFRITIDQKLKKKFRWIGKEHLRALLKISARSVLGSSVIRVFDKDSKVKLQKVLERINIDDLLQQKTQEDYRLWFERHLSILAQVIKSTNPKNKNIHPGYKWRHAAKILNLYIREVVEYKRYFTEVRAAKIRKWLYVPIDSRVMKKLRSLGYKFQFNRINEIDTSQKFYRVQNLLGQAARAAKVPRIYFDDVWVWESVSND